MWLQLPAYVQIRRWRFQSLFIKKRAYTTMNVKYMQIAYIWQATTLVQVTPGTTQSFPHVFAPNFREMFVDSLFVISPAGSSIIGTYLLNNADNGGK